MKRTLLVIALQLVCAASAAATAQRPDDIIIDGKSYSLFQVPLESYFDKSQPRPNEISAMCSTACYRGYTAGWKIREEALYLTEVKGCDGKVIPLAKILGKPVAYGEEVKAVWFSGELRIPDGKMLQYVHMGFGSTFERELRIQISNGRVMGRTTIKNSSEDLRDPMDKAEQELKRPETWLPRKGR